ncbi:MAG TPA: lytic transglycosylase domain-containing protein [Xanthomonadaceae bacterium]|jgi:soluble lytic murein transglycosylase-like protein|nr:lytic transglycosylase domain-containing protein [Xanthomonadaceae bacterium]
MTPIVRSLPIVFALAAVVCVSSAHARTVYRCLRDGTVSLATAPEPGSKCEPKQVDDNAAKLPNLWGVNGTQSGAIYEREQDGVTVYSTRNLPGSTRLMAFTVTPPPDSTAHPGLGALGAPQIAVDAAVFSAAARANGIEDAWLRAIAHAESGMQAGAVSPKGAQGIMQLMPQTSVEYQVPDPFSPAQSIQGGAKYLGELLRRYKGDRRLAAAAYNAGIGAVARYNGIPPYAETQTYVDKVEALYALYQKALAASRPRRHARR